PPVEHAVAARQRPGTVDDRMLGGRSDVRAAALRAEPRARRARGTALAARGARREALAALGAELAAADLRRARRALRHGRRREVRAADEVGRAELVPQLVAARLGLELRELLGLLGRAAHALPDGVVPADLVAHPVAAPVALAERVAHLADGGVERLVLRLRVGLAVRGPRPRRVGQVRDLAAEEAARGLDEAAPLGHDVRLVRGAVAVAAPLAPELELVPARVRQVADVVGEGDGRAHGSDLGGSWG